MVTPFSAGGEAEPRDLAPLGAAVVSGLLVVTNFLACSVAPPVEDFAFAGVAITVFFCTAAFATGALAGLAGTGLAAFFAGLVGAAFFTGAALPAAALGVATFFAGNAFFTGVTFFTGTGFVAGVGLAAFFTGVDAFFAAGLAIALRAAGDAARTTGFERAGIFATVARLLGFCLLFAIPKPIL